MSDNRVKDKKRGIEDISYWNNENKADIFNVVEDNNHGFDYNAPIEIESEEEEDIEIIENNNNNNYKNNKSKDDIEEETEEYTYLDDIEEIEESYNTTEHKSKGMSLNECKEATDQILIELSKYRTYLKPFITPKGTFLLISVKLMYNYCLICAL